MNDASAAVQCVLKPTWFHVMPSGEDYLPPTSTIFAQLYTQSCHHQPIEAVLLFRQLYSLSLAFSVSRLSGPASMSVTHTVLFQFKADAKPDDIKAVRTCKSYSAMCTISLHFRLVPAS
jgi:hypothetical protein